MENKEEKILPSNTITEKDFYEFKHNVIDTIEELRNEIKQKKEANKETIGDRIDKELNNG